MSIFIKSYSIEEYREIRPARIKTSHRYLPSNYASGINFETEDEANKFLQLEDLLNSGKITKLRLQPLFELQSKFVHDGEKHRAIHYNPDFMYYLPGTENTGNFIIEDRKGYNYTMWNLKRKLFLYQNPTIVVLPYGQYR